MVRIGDGAGVWRPGPADPGLHAREAHLWVADLLAGGATGDAEQILSADERERAGRFHFDRHRIRFIAARAALRRIVAAYVKADPAAIRFGYGAFGKPHLETRSGWPDLQFNLAHSGDLALIGVCPAKRIGVDIEYRDAARADMDIAKRFFAPEEAAALESAPAALRPGAFFACWTRKEAYIKARGEGISLGLDTFAVTLLPSDAPALTRSSEGEPERRRWLVFDVAAHPDYAAALVIERGAWRFRCWLAGN